MVDTLPVGTDVCKYCAELIPFEGNGSLNISHHATLWDLLKSSKSCLVCEFLLGDWTHVPGLEKSRGSYEMDFGNAKLSVKVKEIRKLDNGLTWASVTTEVNVGAPVDGITYVISFAITTCDKRKDSNLEVTTAASLPIWRSRISSTSDRITTLQSWLSDCEANHEFCRQHKLSDGKLPKRLIDVGAIDECSVKLTTPDILSNGDFRYATLSYCWGQTNYRTTLENEIQHREQIPLEALPKTVRDAISLTRHLNIPFLWVDALCIVQDDHEEWRGEAANMQNIYSGSVLTIAATDAKDCSLGFLPSASTTSSSQVTSQRIAKLLDVRCEGKDLGLLVRLQRYDADKSVNQSVLNTRGWVLQEMVLSTRTVHCMNSEIYWECKSACHTETGLSSNRLIKDNCSLPKLLNALDNPQGRTNYTWWKWVESYSTRKFSFEQDRLPALAGVLRHYQDHTDDIPVLGLWKRTFAQDMMWMSLERPQKLDHPPTVLRNIPSWSWLSCTSTIQYDFWGPNRLDETYNSHEEDHTTLVDWNVVWTEQPFTSDVNSTELILEGPVEEFVLNIATRGAMNNPTYLDVNNEEVDFKESHFPWRCSGQFDDRIRMTPTKYLCLLLHSRVFTNDGRTSETFLILEPAGNNYKRIGIANFRGKSLNFDVSKRQTLSLV